MKFATVILLTDIFITVEGWPCASPVAEVYSQQNTGTVLRFSADLTNLNSPRRFFLKFHNGTKIGSINYNADKSYATDAILGANITGDTAGRVSLTLVNVQKSSAGIYTLESTGITCKCNCLYILGTPTKPNITVNKVPFIGENVTLSCSSTATTTPSNHSLRLTYNWRVDNEDNPSGSRYSTKKNTLTLSNIIKHDANKQFTCTATEVVSDGYTSSRSHSFSFDVYYGPDIIHINVESPYHVTEGETNVTIECSSDCSPGCSYSWTNLTSGSRISVNDTFTLGTVNRSMAGDYKCTSRNTAALYTKFSEKTLTTIVYYAPDVSTSLSKENTREGENLTLFCNGDGVPSNYNYIRLSQTWNDIEIPNSNTALSGTPKYSSIHFSPLTFQDTGTYTCVLTNGIKNTSGVLNQVSSANILVEVRPKILTGELRFTGSIGGRAEVNISIYSYPKLESLNVRRYDGRLVSSGKYNVFERMVETSFYGKSVLLNGSTFLLVERNLKVDDFGNYTLKLTNRIGTTDIVAFIIAEGRPLPPKVFRYLSDYTIPTFVWEKNFNGGKIQSFVIQTSAEGSELWRNHTNIPENDAQYQINTTFYMTSIRGLQPGTYSARIFSNNSKGESEKVDIGTSFEVFRQTDGSSNSMPIASIAGGIATAVVVIVIVVVVLVVWRRRVRNKEKNISKNASQKTKRMNTSASENAHDENLYEHPEPDAAKQSKKLVNKDGLIYADLAFNDQAKGQENQVIVGFDSMTEYVEVDFTKKAEPLPDSDEEKKQVTLI